MLAHFITIPPWGYGTCIKEEEEEENFEGAIMPAGLLSFEFEQVPCSIFADHRQSCYLFGATREVTHLAANNYTYKVRN
jgi:hypothetical protein